MAERIQAALKLVFRIIAAGVIAIALFVGVFGYFAHRQSLAGKEWCESVIRDYETDRMTFLKDHEKQYRDGMLFLTPPRETNTSWETLSWKKPASMPAAIGRKGASVGMVTGLLVTRKNGYGLIERGRELPFSGPRRAITWL